MLRGLAALVDFVACAREQEKTLVDIDKKRGGSEESSLACASDIVDKLIGKKPNGL
jgi:hypothetical protein